MYYLIVAQDKPGTLQQRLNTRPNHIERLQKLRDQGRLLTAGPLPVIDNEDPGEAGFTGSAIIAEFSSLDEATTWANEDPYLEAGVYDKITVNPYKKVF